ncbi:MAG: hypothetical protein BEN19_02255 [Epulopiscium sp. Nuni2H_MBin003]|nr:MAG: hypothetical protein BEN19_02255 [Epulopiscium sp. Nuni2H_MBin003]
MKQKATSFFCKNCENKLFLDIETTGLRPDKDIILSFSLFIAKNNEILTMLIQNPEEEQILLEKLILLIQDADIIVTYTHFDIFFINQRLKIYNLSQISNFNINLKKIKFAKKIPRSVLEQYLNFQKEYSTTGKELAKINRLYLKQPTSAYETLIMTHNVEDILSCLLIYNFYIIYNSLNADIYPYVEGNFIVCSINVALNLNSNINFKTDDIIVEYDISTCTLLLKLEIISLTLKKPLVPHTNYVYVKGQILHKSLAKFVIDTKTKVKKEDCFLEETSLFLKCPINYSDVWYDKDKNKYTPVTTNTNLILRIVQYYFNLE